MLNSEQYLRQLFMHQITKSQQKISLCSLCPKPWCLPFPGNTQGFKSCKVDLRACVSRDKHLRLFQSGSFFTVPLLWCAGKHDENWHFWCLWFSLFACWRFNTVCLLVFHLSRKNIHAFPITMCWSLFCSGKFNILPIWIKNRSNFRNAWRRAVGYVIFVGSIMGSVRSHLMSEFYLVCHISPDKSKWTE